MASFDREAMLEMFIYEMSQLIDQLENNTIQNDECYSNDTINEIFRIMHTIKGSAAMMLFTNISVTAHAIEDLIFYLRENKPQNVDYRKVTDLVLEVVDFIKGELEKIELGEEANASSEELTSKIRDFINEIKLKEENKNINNVPKVSENKNINDINDINDKDNNNDNMIKYFAKIFFVKDTEMENVRAYTIIRNLEEISSNIETYPSDILDEKSLDIIHKDGFSINFNSKYTYEYVKDTILKSIYIKDLTLEIITNNKEDNILKKLDNLDRNKLYEYDIEISFEEDSEMENIRAYAIVHNLKDIAFKISHEPEDLLDDSSIEKIRKDGIKINIVTQKVYEEIESILSKIIYLKDLSIIEKIYKEDSINKKCENNIEIDKEIIKEHKKDHIEIKKDDIENKEEIIKESDKNIKKEIKEDTKKDDIETKSQLQQKEYNQQQKIKKTSVHAISVSVQKLDQLLNLVGELVISEAMVTQNPDLENLELDSFTKEARQLHKIINDIQDTVMSMRMVPLSPTFFKMHRIVRDMCRQLKKEVQLEVIGEETEVDKNIIEHISDPLMHIIRNSVDHGIEVPEIRKKLGKPEKGTVVLEAKNSGGDVLIIVRDDGAGFNREKIMNKAKKQGLLIKPENEYTDKEVFQFIFLPGFSTNEQVTSFSGRGVGMDVVATNIDIVGGSVIADSIEGEGSVFTLKIPLTLAIIEGMLINIGYSKFTIPIVSIKRSFKATEKDIIIDPNGNEMILVRGECYNLLRLKQYFEINEGKDILEDGIVLMLENENQTICVFADELIGEQQVVVKNIPKYIKKIPGISGCTLLGNGDISLIIDISGFFNR